MGPNQRLFILVSIMMFKKWLLAVSLSSAIPMRHFVTSFLYIAHYGHSPLLAYKKHFHTYRS